MPQIPREIVKARAARLRDAAAARRTRWLDTLIHTDQHVLIENDGNGHADNFAPVAIHGGRRGDAGRARIIAREGDRLKAIWA
jgi:threonylcarbamoyladenosine tRNA methylthiotransferase MtaB